MLGQYKVIDIRFSGDFDISFIVYMIVNNNVQGEKKDLALIRVVDRINKCVSKMVITPNRIDLNKSKFIFRKFHIL